MMIRMRVLFLLLALAACAPQPPSGPNPTAVIAAERAFATRASDVGWVLAFKEYAAPDAVNFTPEPGNAHAWLNKQKDDGDKALAWWPAFAGASAAGDLGFTTGPARYAGKPVGNYFTVWKKQPDGRWLWIFDAGAGAPAANPPVQDSVPEVIPLPVEKAASAQAARAEVSAREAAMAAGMDLAATNVAALAPDAWAMREKQPPAQGEAARLLIGAGPNFGESTPQGGAAAASGDLVFTYGELRWTEGETRRRGHYARIWQHRKDGWQIVFDQLVPVGKP
jgi:ketosteroid isomerase-like protein